MVVWKRIDGSQLRQSGETIPQQRRRSMTPLILQLQYCPFIPSQKIKQSFTLGLRWLQRLSLQQPGALMNQVRSMASITTPQRLNTRVTSPVGLNWERPLGWEVQRLQVSTTKSSCPRFWKPGVLSQRWWILCTYTTTAGSRCRTKVANNEERRENFSSSK